MLRTPKSQALSPRFENTLSTGADDAGAQNMLSNKGLSKGNCSHILGKGFISSSNSASFVFAM
jgi:hypothetical protein